MLGKILNFISRKRDMNHMSNEEVKRIKVAHDESSEDKISASDNNIKNIQGLPDDVFRHCLEFVGKGNFAFVAPVSKHFYWNYINLGVEMKNNVIDVDVILQQGSNRRTTARDVATGSLRLATECFLKAPKSFQEEVCCQAAFGGRLDILKCAVAIGVDMESVFPKHNADGKLSRDTFDQLAEIVANDHLDVIEFLHKQGVHLDDEYIVTEVGGSGKASSLHWMISKGIISSSWKNHIFSYLVHDGEIDILKDSYETSSHLVHGCTFMSCAEGGNVEVMNWLLQKNVCEWDSHLFSSAAESGSIPMMELCLQNGCPPDEEYICAGAMVNKNKEAALTALKWLHEKNVPWDERVCEQAAAYGNLKALKWARENGCPWRTYTFNDAAQYGHTDILDYCFENDCPLNLENIYYYPYYEAYEDRHLPNPTNPKLEERSLAVYKWLHQHSIPWDDEAGLAAAKEGHLVNLMWAIENGCPWHEDILKEAFKSYNMPMVEYCLERLSPTDADIYVLAMNTMNNSNQKKMANVTDAQIIKMLQKIHDYGIPWSRDIISCAERLGRSNVASWLRCVGCPQ